MRVKNVIFVAWPRKNAICTFAFLNFGFWHPKNAICIFAFFWWWFWHVENAICIFAFFCWWFWHVENTTCIFALFWWSFWHVENATCIFALLKVAVTLEIIQRAFLHFLVLFFGHKKTHIAYLHFFWVIFQHPKNTLQVLHFFIGDFWASNKHIAFLHFLSVLIQHAKIQIALLHFLFSFFQQHNCTLQICIFFKCFFYQKQNPTVQLCIFLIFFINKIPHCNFASFSFFLQTPKSSNIAMLNFFTCFHETQIHIALLQLHVPSFQCKTTLMFFCMVWFCRFSTLNFQYNHILLPPYDFLI